MIEQFIQFSLCVALIGFFDNFLRQMRCKLLDKIIHKTPQKRTTTKTT